MGRWVIVLKIVGANDQMSVKTQQLKSPHIHNQLVDAEWLLSGITLTPHHNFHDQTPVAVPSTDNISPLPLPQ